MQRATVKPLPRYIAGVDPGVNTAVGVYDRHESRITLIASTDFFGVVPWLTRNVRLSDLKVFVEVPPKFIFGRNTKEAGDLQYVRDRKAFLTGGIYREAVLMAEQLRREGFEVQEVPPVRQEKWDQATFKWLCKSSRETNEHERDACRIAYIYATKREIVYAES